MSPTGHLAIGFMSKYYSRNTSIFLLLFAAWLIDILFFIFLALGIDSRSFDPWSHSLIMALVWSFLASSLTYLFLKNTRAAIILGLVAFSHWILDFIVWNNLPVGFNETNLVGLGFYNRLGFDQNNPAFNSSAIIPTALELVMLVWGIIIFVRTRRSLLKQNKPDQVKS